MSSMGSDNWNKMSDWLFWLMIFGICCICLAVVWFMLLLEAAVSH